MDLYSITAKLVKEELTKEHTLQILKTDLLGIRLQDKITLSDQKEILDVPIKISTSKLLAEDGSKVFRLPEGGHMTIKGSDPFLMPPFSSYCTSDIAGGVFLLAA